MNVIELCGGLGNQLFQYAFGQAQKYNGMDVRYSARWYIKPQEPPRPYRLDKFQINMEYSSLSLIIGQHTIKEKGCDLSLLKRKNCNFHGYWQYLDYFEDILPILQNEFYVQEQYYTKEFLKLRKQIISKSAISIHVRRTDYIARKGFGVLPLFYYFEALEMIDGNVYVFSDDIEWCKSVFKTNYFDRRFIFVHLEDYLDFELMRLCTHHILANSTFGWWTAILDDAPGKIVITPPGWLSLDGTNDNGRERNFPKHWIRL